MKKPKAILLGDAQAALESAHREMLLAKKTAQKAQERLEAAEAAYQNAMLALNESVSAIKAANKISVI